ncbi:hypothetical protein LXL04_011181 [Taraxacum kok-saghyz]
MDTTKPRKREKEGNREKKRETVRSSQSNPLFAFVERANGRQRSWPQRLFGVVCTSVARGHLSTTKLPLEAYRLMCSEKGNEKERRLELRRTELIPTRSKTALLIEREKTADLCLSQTRDPEKKRPTEEEAVADDA